jgi:hypothetical protein
MVQTQQANEPLYRENPSQNVTLLARPAQYRVECRRLDDIMLSEWFSYDTEPSYPKRKKDYGLLLGVINKAVLALPLVRLSAMRWPSITNTIHQKPVKIYFAHTCLLSNNCGEDFHTTRYKSLNYELSNLALQRTTVMAANSECIVG